MILHAEDPAYPTEADAEILGTGTLLCLILVTPMILLAYSVEGRKAVQSTSLDCLFSFAGACLLIAAGGMTCFAWNKPILMSWTELVTAGIWRWQVHLES